MKQFFLKFKQRFVLHFWHTMLVFPEHLSFLHILLILSTKGKWPILSSLQLFWGIEQWRRDFLDSGVDCGQPLFFGQQSLFAFNKSVATKSLNSAKDNIFFGGISRNLASLIRKKMNFL